MTEFSRTKKYQDLRQRLQHDTGSEVLGGKELSAFSERLDQLDENIYDKPIYVGDDSRLLNHARNVSSPSQPVPTRTQLHKNQQALEEEIFGVREETSTPSFDNDYLDQYIREVKQYNIDQGNAETENTSMNILRQIERNQESNTPLRRPYKRSNDSTVDIPFISETYQSQSSKQNTEQLQQTPSKDLVSNTQNLSKEDIMAEVQNMVNGSFASSEPAPQKVQTEQVKVDEAPTKQFQANQFQTNKQASPFEEEVDMFQDMGTDTFMRNFQRERLTNQQLLNETTKMRAQLDDYEDNLNEVTDKMRRTSQIMNIILVVLIIALLVILFIVIYFIMITRGN